jgi:hypothetical protein
MLGDGGTSVLTDACGYVNAYNNQVIDTTNFGITTTAGHDASFYNNRIISAGVLSDGRAIAAQNVGASIWDMEGNALLLPPTWFNNTGHDNVIGWANGAGRNDWWIPNAASWINNTHWTGPITLSLQAAEGGVWRAKLASNVMRIGPS